MESADSVQPKQTEDISSRVTRLEMARFYERQSDQQRLDDMSRRLFLMETGPSKVLDSAGYLKIGLALALPLAVFLLTGSVEKAVTTLRMVGGH